MILYLLALTIVTWAFLLPLLIDAPTLRGAIPEPVFDSVPNATFDPKGMV